MKIRSFENIFIISNEQRVQDREDREDRDKWHECKMAQTLHREDERCNAMKCFIPMVYDSDNSNSLRW